MTYLTLLLLAPFVFLANLVLFHRQEVVLDVERLSDLFRCFSLNHICNCLACNVKEPLDIQVVRCQY